jgi:hypothetical protein
MRNFATLAGKRGVVRNNGKQVIYIFADVIIFLELLK